MLHKFTIPDNQPKTRLDIFLHNEIPILSRSALAKKIKIGSVLINNKIAEVHTFLKPGDSVIFDDDLQNDKKSRHEKQPATKLKINLKKIIISETDDFIVIDKPAGLIVHPDAKHKDDTLVDLLVEYHKPISKVGEDPSRPGIVHRIDKDVSGLMVIAKNQKAFDNLKNQFKQHQTRKKYHALVYGKLDKPEGEIKFRIGRSAGGGKMAAIPENETRGKSAWTHYKVLQEFKNTSLVLLDIFSGRTHQIRVHLNALKHPVLGDQLYYQKKFKPIQTNRLMLQSTELSFNDPTSNDLLTFSLPLAPAIKSVIESLN